MKKKDKANLKRWCTRAQNQAADYADAVGKNNDPGYLEIRLSLDRIVEESVRVLDILDLQGRRK